MTLKVERIGQEGVGAIVWAYWRPWYWPFIKKERAYRNGAGTWFARAGGRGVSFGMKHKLTSALLASIWEQIDDNGTFSGAQ